ncbi:glycine betaine ABC transporter substrate-binding protein [Kitasatospora sp. NPDC127059]|uniref:glycine betaine ABC transporter substrate-binding protein n=1 Tax=unclassified Kitasatospora TaxID=2633591 RepID=UPI00365D58C6
MPSRTRLHPLTVGTIALSFHRGTAAVVRRILEAYGHPVSVVEAPHEELFRRQAAGEIDFLVSAWLPSSHEKYLAGHRDEVTVLAPHYEPYCIWAVPPYVPASEVAEVGDLTRPDVAERMTRVIDGINPGAGISRFSARMVVNYGLDRAGYRFAPGDEAGFVARVERGLARRERFVIPLWRPQYLNRRHALRPLAEPKGLLGSVDAASPVVRRDALERIHPEALAGLAAFEPGNDGVEDLDVLINVDGLTPLQAADRYLAANPHLLPPYAPTCPART